MPQPRSSRSGPSGPSPHLSWRELACKDGTPYPERWRTSRAVVLAETFEAIRARVGKPLQVLSGYRTPAHNKKVGGARFSQHLEGRALDLRPPPGWSVDRLYEVVRSLVGLLPIGGIGRYPTFVHVDIRLTERLVVWSRGRWQADQSDRLRS